MLDNSTEKMVLISSTTNEWPQNDSQGLNMASTRTMVLEKQQLQQQQIPQESPKCPRCNSLKTKFCYYNNYSLSQPRHFCKDCKRYWTRGGTLRSVPVGGGCRKNKKIKRSFSTIDLPLTSSSPTSMPSYPNTIHSQVNPIFFGLPQNSNPSSEIGKLPYLSFNHRVSSGGSIFDFSPQVNGFGLGSSNNNGNDLHGLSNPSLSSYNSLFGSLTNSSTLATLLGSSLNQEKIINNTNGGFQGLGSFEELQMDGNGNIGLRVKREEGQICQSPKLQNNIEKISTSDPVLYWNATNVGAWHDTPNLGSSVPSLI